MREWQVDRWVGIAVTFLVAGSALPVLFGITDLLVPRSLWAVLFAITFAALVVLWRAETKRFQYALYAITVPLSWVLVSTAPQATLQGFSTIVVAIAATGVYIVRLPISLAIVVANAVVVGFAIRAIVPDVLSSVGMGAFFLFLQLALILIVHLLRREQQLRGDLTEAYLARQTAEAILSETARSAERLSIARELHDVLGHQLTLLTLQLEAAKHQHGADRDRPLEAAQIIARTLLGDVREVVSDLRTSQVSSLAETLREFGTYAPNLDINVEVSGDLNIDEAQQIVLLRAVQEIVTNTLRHSEARELSVVVHGGNDVITLAASDDGAGSPFPVVPGNGLRGLEERVTQLGGGVEFLTQPGFRVRAWMPTR